MILRNRPIASATALIVLSSCSFGSLTTLTVLITREGLPLMPAMLWRYLLAAIMLFVVCRKTLTATSRAQAVRLMVIGGLGQAIITYLSLRALDYLPVGPLAFLFYTYPAWVVLISAVRGTGEITLPRFTALLLAMIGIAMMVGMPSAESLNVTGVVLALGTALIYAIYLPVLHKVQAGIPPMSSAFYLVTGVFVSFMIASVFTGSMQLPRTPSIWGLVLLLALVSTVIAFVSLIAGLHILGPVRTSIVATIEPFFTVLLGVIVLGESLAFPTIAGGALIAGAVLLLQWTDAVRTPLEPIV